MIQSISSILWTEQSSNENELSTLQNQTEKENFQNNICKCQTGLLKEVSRLLSHYIG